MTSEYPRNINVWKDEVNFHLSSKTPYITYNSLQGFSDVFALTTLRNSSAEDPKFCTPDYILAEILQLIVYELKISNVKVVSGRQIHSTNIVDVFATPDKEIESVNILIYPDTDGLITSNKGTALCILTADCLPIFLYDSVKQVACLIHAGKKGTEEGISEFAVRKMIENYNCDARDIFALIGASIGPCCYPVNLWSENYKQLTKYGVRNIQNPEICTGCNMDLFYSYRVEKGTAGRMISVIMMQ